MHTVRMTVWVLLGVWPLVLAGCNSQASSESDTAPSAKANKQEVSANGTKTETAPKDDQPTDNEEPKTVVAPPEEIKLTMPTVQLSEDHASTCLVKMGDAMPEFSLADLDGTVRKLADLRGAKATVVLFWASKNLYGPDALGELQKISAEYGEQGVKVLAVCRDGVAGDVKPITDQVQTGYPQLLDPEAAAYGKVATKLVPRIYLLDDEGKIVWLAVTYDPQTGKTLRQGLDFMLGETK